MIKNLPTFRKGDSEVTDQMIVYLLCGVAAGVLVHFGLPIWFAIIVAITVYWCLVRYRWGLLMDASRASKSKSYEECLELSKKYIARYPRLSKGYFFAVTAALNLRKPQIAKLYCEQALNAGMDRTYVFYYLMATYKSLMEPISMLAAANEYIELQPTHAIGYLYKAYALLFLRDYEGAIEECQRFQFNHKYSNNALIIRASANLAMNKIDLAKRDCDVVIEKLVEKPSAELMAAALSLEGSILARKHSFNEAIENYRKALELFPDAEWMLINRAHCYCSLGQYDLALQDLAEAKREESSPFKSAFRLSNAARVHLCQGELDLAVSEAREAVDIFADIPNVLATSGLVLTRHGQFEDAKVMLDKAITLDKYCAEAYWFRHELFEKMGEPQKASQDKRIAQDYGYKPYI